MKNIKIMVIVSLAILLSSSLISCNSTNEKETEEESTTVEETKETNTEEKKETEEANKEENETEKATEENKDDAVIKKGEPLPDLEFSLLNGSKIKLSDYKDKIVLLNFWTTWWPYCQKELPSLNKINERDDIVVIAVDVNESKNTINKFLEKNEITTYLALDEDGKLASMFQIASFPTTYFINKDNILIGGLPSMVDDEMLEDIITKIKNNEL